MRPSMEKAVRHSDGTMICAGEWSSIRATGRLIMAELLALPPPKDPLAKNRLRTKNFFKSFLPLERDKAMERAEQQQPLLALCCSHWKADQVVGNALRIKRAGSLNESDSDPEEDPDVERPNIGKKRTRPTSPAPATSPTRSVKRSKPTKASKG
jgi:hypothetical protein